jgi:hypothetical protein
MIKYGLILILIVSSSALIARIPSNLLSTVPALRALAAGTITPAIVAPVITNTTSKGMNGFEHYQKYCDDLNRKENNLREKLTQLDTQYQTACKNEEEFDVKLYLSQRAIAIKQIKEVQEEKTAALHD